MKVKELIERLQKENPESEVCLIDFDGAAFELKDTDDCGQGCHFQLFPGEMIHD